MSKRVKSRAQELRKRKPSKAYEQGFGQNGGVSSLGTTYEDTDSDGVLDTIVKNSPRIGAFKRTVGVVNRSYLPSAGPVDNPPTSTTTIPDMTGVAITGDSQTVDLSNHFSDADGDTITYVVGSADTAVVTVAEAGGTLTATTVNTYGTPLISVTGTANGKSTSQTFRFNLPTPFNITTRDIESNILAITPVNPANEATIAYGDDTSYLYVFDGTYWYFYLNN